jgi:hypothetical protein
MKLVPYLRAMRVGWSWGRVENGEVVPVSPGCHASFPLFLTKVKGR